MQKLRARDRADLYAGVECDAQGYDPLFEVPEVQQAHLVQKDMEEMKKAAPTAWVLLLCVGLRFAMLRIV